MRTSMLKALKQIADARQKLASGSASDAELMSAVNASTKVALDCTDHIIKLINEVVLLVVVVTVARL